MRVYEELGEKEGEIALTIGNFDGVHKGHQTLLNAMRKTVGPSGTLKVVTFSIHPSHVLTHLEEIEHISSNPLKIKCLTESGVDITHSIPFTEPLAALSYEEFLEQLRPFDHLFLGKGAALGRKREGTEEKITELAEKWGFQAHYINKLGAISSGKIRAAINEGTLDIAAEMLGRPYTLLGEGYKGIVQIAPYLCLPPVGTYPVLVQAKEGAFTTTCHIGNEITLSTPIDGQVEILFDPLQSKKK